MADMTQYVGNWKDIPVNKLASEYNYEETDKDDGPYLCHYGNYPVMGFHTDISTNRRKSWICGVPKIGKGGGGKAPASHHLSYISNMLHRSRQQRTHQRPRLPRRNLQHPRRPVPEARPIQGQVQY